MRSYTKKHNHTKSSMVDMLGIKIHRVTMSEAIEQVDEMVRVGGSYQVLTPNVDHVMLYSKDELFRCVYDNGDLIVADGMPLVWASKLFGDPLPERVTGSDMMPQLCELAARREYKIYIMGGQIDSAVKASKKLTTLYPGLNVVGTSCPAFGFENDMEMNQRIIKDINHSKPDILFVAIGTPKQEKWIFNYKNDLDVTVLIGVGATIDFLAGAVKRAPRFTHKIGMEWLWRLMCEPRRLWRRYLINDMPFLWKVLSKKIRKKKY